MANPLNNATAQQTGRLRHLRVAHIDVDNIHATPTGAIAVDLTHPDGARDTLIIEREGVTRPPRVSDLK